MDSAVFPGVLGANRPARSQAKFPLGHDTCLGNPVGKDDCSSVRALCMSTGSGGVR